MRISELSRQTGVPVATIKFYLRQRLLPPGRSTSRNQAQYGEEHRRRLDLIKAFTNIGQLDLSSVHTLLSAIEDESVSIRELLRVVNTMLFKSSLTTTDHVDTRDAEADVSEVLRRVGWQVGTDAPGYTRLVQVLTAMQRLGCEDGTDTLLLYAEAIDRLGASELELLSFDADKTDRAAAVARAMLLEEALAATRQLAQEHHIAQRCGRDSSAPCG